MPKAWEDHKAELVRLYSTEGRPLKDVQNILQRRHGFKASTRAYRMKIDEWGLQKYKTTKERPTPRRLRKGPEHRVASLASLQASSVARLGTEEEEEEVQLMFGDVSIPAGPMGCSELLEMIDGPNAYRHALEILLVKWQPDGRYMKAALRFLQDDRYCMAITADPPTPNLLVLTDRNVPWEEQPVLTRALLEADLALDSEVFFDHHDDVPSWIKQWRLAAKDTDWNEAKRSLWHPDLKDQFPMSTFRCFLAVIAERLLDRIKIRLEYLRTRQAPLSSSDSDDAELYRRQYVDILKEGFNGLLDLNPLVYKYAVKILEWDLALAKNHQESQRKQNELLMEKEAKYVELISILSNKPINSIDDNLDALLRDAHSSKDCHIRSDPRYPLSSRQPSAAKDGLPSLTQREDQHERSPTYLSFDPRKSLLNMHRAWKERGESPSGILVLVLERELKTHSVSRATGAKSIFDLISGLLSKGEQPAFTKAVLLSYLRLKLTEPWASTYEFQANSPHSFGWLGLLSLIEDWAEFKTALGKVNLEDLMSVDAAKLVLEHTFVVFAERHLELCKNRIDSSLLWNNHESIDAEEEQGQWKNQKDHDAILADLRTRCANEQRMWRSQI